MAVINYPFQVVNASNVGVTGIVFGTTVGSTPGIASCDKMPATVSGSKTAISTPTISFVEFSNGFYAAQFDAVAQAADCMLVVDAGSALSGANRYVGVPLNRDSSFTIFGAILAATGLDAMLADVANDADGRSSGLKMLRYIFDSIFDEFDGTTTSKTIKNDAGTIVGIQPIVDSGSVVTRGKSS